MVDIVEEEINTFGRDIGLEVDADGLEDVFGQHADELSTDEMLNLVQGQMGKSTEVIGEEVMMTMEIKEFLRKFEEVHSVIEMHPPNKVNAGRGVNLCEENARWAL